MADFTGTSGDDVITGTSDSDVIDVSQGGNDTVDAAGGDDTIFIGATLNARDHLDGGDGFDVLQLDGDYSHGVTLGAHTIANIEEITFAAGHDYHFKLSNGNVVGGAALTVDGSALSAADSLYLDGSKVKHGTLDLIGGAGNDTLIGGAGGGMIDGGDGNDIIYSDGTDASTRHFGVHVIDGGAGNDQIVVANGDTVQGGDGDDGITFGYFNGHDGDLGHVDGGAGDDQVTIFNADIHAGELQGGTGTDTLIIENTVHLDMAEFSAASSGFEVLQLGSSLIVGDGTDNTFDFSGFVVTLGSALGVFGGAGDDTLIGVASVISFAGGDGNDVLIGGASSDFLYGDDGNDVLVGSTGQDRLSGGAGADVFRYLNLQDSMPGNHTFDIIVDFHHAEGDLIDLSAIDADTTQGGDQAFHLGGSSFTDSPGELIQFIDANGHTVLEGDVNGDGITDFKIQLNHAPILSGDDFIL